MRLATAAMGTRFELVIEDEGPERHRGAAEAALAAIEECHARFSRFLPESLVAHLARIPAGTAVRLDRDTFELFASAVEVWRCSRGAFDITGGAACMAAIRLDAHRGTIALDRAGVLLDLGAIAKGHALDLAALALREAGVVSAFLHGGTSSAIGIGPKRWAIALSADAVIELWNAALAVSRTGHDTPHPTYDPATGKSLDVERWVAVTGPSARLCDAWATAVAVLGREPLRMPLEYELRSTVYGQRSTECPAAAAS